MFNIAVKDFFLYTSRFIAYNTYCVRAELTAI